MNENSIVALTNQGVVRENNEDAYCFGQVKSLAIRWLLVADGMGGHNAGEVASQMLCDHFERQFNQLNTQPDDGWNGWIEKQFVAANSAIFTEAQTNNDRTGMGTTGVFALIEDIPGKQNKGYIAWVGDSRAYQWFDNKLTLLTEDHSMIQYLLNKGAITQKEADRSNTKHLLSRALGVKNTVEVDAYSGGLADKVLIVLTSDGIHDYLSEQELSKSLTMIDSASSKKQVSNTEKEIVSKAIKMGSRDNLTIGIIKVN